LEEKEFRKIWPRKTAKKRIDPGWGRWQTKKKEFPRGRIGGPFTGGKKKGTSKKRTNEQRSGENLTFQEAGVGGEKFSSGKGSVGNQDVKN